MESQVFNRYELYAAGAFGNGIGSCSWYAIDTESRDLRNCKGTMVGPTSSLSRMRLRAMFEGLYRIPVGSTVTLYSELSGPYVGDEDIKSAIRQVVRERRLTVTRAEIALTDPQDLPWLPGEILWVTTLWAQEALNKNQHEIDKTE